MTFYGITIVTKVQWDNILTKSQSDGCTCKRLLQKQLLGQQSVFEMNDVVTIIGMRVETFSENNSDAQREKV